MSSNDLWNTLAQGLLGFTISVLIVFIIENRDRKPKTQQV
jgi:hypothetical protein